MPTKQFKWIDRDTAARDLLQLVYHAPPQIAERAIKLLKAIRSPAIIPELKAMFLDPEFDMRSRREIYHAICATPGNIDFSEFEAVISEVFGSYNFYAYVFHLLKHHPINASWIAHDIENKNLGTQKLIYLNLASYFPNTAIDSLLNLLCEHPHSLRLLTVQRLYRIKDIRVENYLAAQQDKIIWLFLTLDAGEEVDTSWMRLLKPNHWDSLLDQWPALKDAVSKLTSTYVFNITQHENSARQRLIYMRLLPYAPQTACYLLLKLIDEKQIFLDLETAGLLHQYGDETVQSWLNGHWDELIYLCLIDNIGIWHHLEKVRIVHILENWHELKVALFHHAPSMAEEYNQLKTQYESCDEFFDLISDDDIRRTSTWQEVEQQHNQWLQSNKHLSRTVSDLYHRGYLGIDAEADIPQVAVKTYFLGTALDITHDSSFWLFYLLRESDDKWRYKWVSEFDGEQSIFVRTPVRFEAAYALRNHHKPDVWIKFIEAFLVPQDVFGVFTDRMFENHLYRWISRMTDILSGVEPELPDEEIPLSARRWFRALVTQTQNEPIP